MSARNPEKLFEDVSRFIIASNDALKRGAFTELTGLDDQIRTLCEEILQLTPEQRSQYPERLQQLLNDLQALGETLVSLRDGVSEEMKELANRKKANLAYTNAPIPEKKKQDEQ